MKFLLLPLVLVLSIALYFDWANYSLGFDAGKSSNANDIRQSVSASSFESGRKTGVAAGQQTCQSEVNAQVQDRVNIYQQKYSQDLQQAFEAGKAAEAMLIMNRGLGKNSAGR